MKLITPVLTAVSVMFALAACQKDASSDNSTTIKNKIKTYTEDVTSTVTGHKVTTFNLSYDDQDRLTSIVATNVPGFKFVYTYTSDKQFSEDMYTNNQIEIHTTYFLNSFSLIDSSFQYNNTQDSSCVKSIYNSSKQLIKDIDYDYSSSTGSVMTDITNYTYDNNGNVTKAVDYNGEDTYYYDSLINNTINPLPKYFPVMQKQLPTRAEYKENGDDITSVHTYTFDSSKRVLSDKEVYSDGSVVIKSYTYY